MAKEDKKPYASIQNDGFEDEELSSSSKALTEKQEWKLTEKDRMKHHNNEQSDLENGQIDTSTVATNACHSTTQPLEQTTRVMKSNSSRENLRRLQQEPEEEQPGAYRMEGRAVGEIPVWGQSSGATGHPSSVPANNNVNTTNNGTHDAIDVEEKKSEQFIEATRVDAALAEELNAVLAERDRLKAQINSAGMVDGEVSKEKNPFCTKFRITLLSIILLISVGVVAIVIVVLRDAASQKSTPTSSSSYNSLEITLSNNFTTDVDSIFLARKRLTGEIPTTIGLFTQLLDLDLSGNHLTGTIPTEIGYLTNLKELKIKSALLEGTIPTQIGLLTQLKVLNLSINSLRGSVPSEIGLLSNLSYLNLGDNINLVMEISFDWRYFMKLKNLRLFKTSLEGIIPTYFGFMTTLTKLSLSNSNLEGSIPSELGFMTNLEELRLSDTKLTGTIATELGRLTKLTLLDLSLNNLSGGIPVELGQLTKLSSLCLGENKQLFGKIPKNLLFDMGSSCAKKPN